MFIRLFIKTIDNDKVEIANKYIMSCINEDNIKYKDVKTEHYWKVNVFLTSYQSFYYCVTRDYINLYFKE